MFDVIVNGHRHTRRRDVAPLVISWAVHALAIGAVVLLPVLFATEQLPVAPNEVLAYVAVAPPPPPPPPPPPAAAPAVKRSSPRATPSSRPAPEAPVTAPRELPPSVEVVDEGEAVPDFDSIGGVAGGVPGGVPGGVIGGVVDGLLNVPPPPPPPPPPAARRPPVRAGGQIQAPALVKRVPPIYPPMAVSARVQGVVILEATVGRDGRVEDVVVLRSVRLLDAAAIEAVRQWEYAPLLLNGQAERFVLTVRVSFNFREE
jgi:protein TonB